MRKLVYYVAASLDGFIADENGDAGVFPVRADTLSALFARYPETCPGHLRQELGITGDPRRFDTVIMGFRTHEPALQAGLTRAYPHLRQIVVTHRSLPHDPTVEAWAGDPASRMAALKKEPGRDIWLCGGGDLAAQLAGQIDELQIKLNPLSLGAGTPLFAGAATHAWRLRSLEELPGGVGLLTHDAVR